MKYQYIDSERKLCQYIGSLSENGIKTIALDIEGESNLHHYGERLCLVQIFDGTHAVIVDPFKIPMEPLRQLVENRAILKIMYDAPGDRAFLYKNCGMDILSVLDLRAAVELLEFEKKDLSSVLKQTLQIDSGRSKKRLQRYNWNRRPLDDYAIAYALTDVLHLFELKDCLLSEMVRRQLLEEFILRNLQAQNKPHNYDTRPKLLRSRRFKSLKGKEQAVFRRLFQIREDYARRLDYPANSVFAGDLLFELVSAQAGTQDIEFGKRIPSEVRDRIITEIEGAMIDPAGG